MPPEIWAYCQCVGERHSDWAVKGAQNFGGVLMTVIECERCHKLKRVKKENGAKNDASK